MTLWKHISFAFFSLLSGVFWQPNIVCIQQKVKVQSCRKNAPLVIPNNHDNHRCFKIEVIWRQFRSLGAFIRDKHSRDQWREVDNSRNEKSLHKNVKKATQESKSPTNEISNKRPLPPPPLLQVREQPANTLLHHLLHCLTFHSLTAYNFFFFNLTEIDTN